MWDSPSRESSRVAMEGVGIFFVLLIVGIISFFSSLYKDYKYNIINQSQNTIVSKIKFKEVYRLYEPDYDDYELYSSSLPDEVIKDDLDYDIYYFLLERETIKLRHNQYKYFITDDKEYFITKNTFHSLDRKGKEEYVYKISSTFLDDGIWLCANNVLTKDCITVRQYFKYEE